MRNYFPKRPSGAPLHTLSKLYDVPVGFVNPPPYFEAEYCLFCGRRRVAVARYNMICLVLTIEPVGVSVLCWLAAPVAMFYGNLQNLVISSKSVIKSSSVISSQIGVMSDQLRVSLYIVMSQNVM